MTSWSLHVITQVISGVYVMMTSMIEHVDPPKRWYSIGDLKGQKPLPSQ